MSRRSSWRPSRSRSRDGPLVLPGPGLRRCRAASPRRAAPRPRCPGERLPRVPRIDADGHGRIAAAPGEPGHGHRPLQADGSRSARAGMGVVYVAEQSRPVRRKVALKIIKPGMDTKQVIARFEAERQALAMMDHPNIAKVHDGGATESGPPLLRHGAGPRHPDHRLLRPRAALDPRAAGAVRPGLPGGAARPPEGDHPPRPQALEHPRDGHRRRRRAQGHRLRRGQGDRRLASPSGRSTPPSSSSSARRCT